MFKNSLLAVLLLSSIARAQPEVEPGAGSTSPAPPLQPATTGDPFQKGTLGFSFPMLLLSNLVSTAAGLEPVPTVDIVYFLDNKSAIDIIGGANLHKKQVLSTGTPPMTTDQTSFGFAAGIGYRIYTHKDKLHAFIEPEAVLGFFDVQTSSTFYIRPAILFGAERTLADWFSLSGAIGAQAQATNSFHDLQLASTAQLNANFYFK